MKSDLHFLDYDSLVFLCDLLNCILCDIEDTIFTTEDSEYLKILDYSKSKLSLVYQRLQNFIIIRKDFNL